MTVPPPVPDGPPTPEPGESPDLPDPSFPEVLPGGDPGPGEAPDLDPETEPDDA